MNRQPKFTPPPPYLEPTAKRTGAGPMYNNHSFVQTNGAGSGSDSSLEYSMNLRSFYSHDQLSSGPSHFNPPAQNYQADAEGSIQDNQNLVSWLQQLNLDPSAQHDQQNFSSELPVNGGLQQPAVSVNVAVPSSPINENNGNNTRDLELLTLQLARQIIEANQSLAAQQRQISELKNNLVAQDRSQHGRNQFPDHKASGQFSINNNPGYNRSIRRSAARPYEPAMPVDPHNTGHPSRRAYTPPVLPPQTPPPRQAGKKKGRHHRTATPEQRQLRALTNGRPVYTLGIDPQTDRGLICDFFEQIKSWSAAYTVQLGALATEKIQELATNAGLVGYLGTALQFSKMIMEPDMLKSIVSAIVSRYVFAYTVGEHAMFLSRHIDANVCERLNQAWAQLSDHEHEKKVELLALQRDIYTRIKGAEDFKDWRTTCAKDFTTQLLSKLNGFLITNLPFTTAKDRDHRLQELFVKGYRIGFRLRMEAVWQFTWPIPGDQLQPAIMVNESRNLYGDMITTMREVMNSPNEHCVRFAVSPTMIKTDFSAGGEKKEVVHSALVHISPKRWL